MFVLPYCTVIERALPFRWVLLGVARSECDRPSWGKGEQRKKVQVSQGVETRWETCTCFLLLLLRALPCKQPFQGSSERQLRARGSGALRCFDPRLSHKTTRGRLIWFPARLLCPCECLSRTRFEVNLPERESRLLQVGPSADWTARRPSRWKHIPKSVASPPSGGWALRFPRIVIWLILPVAICLSQRLSHACPSTSLIKVKPRMAH